MPRSAVIYTNQDAFARLREEARRKFENLSIKPYTFSHPQRTDARNVRVRITELADGALGEELARLVERGEATLASDADRDVRSQSYEELREDADRARWEVALQFASPVIVEAGGRAEPYPVLGAVFGRYVEVWNAFSEEKIGQEREGLAHVHVVDFKISCVASAFGPGSQGWVRLEMEKGRTEAELGLFNGLVDFAFYCGTGVHVEEGLGQTRRMEKTGRYGG
jgi:hypothetical protein